MRLFSTLHALLLGAKLPVLAALTADGSLEFIADGDHFKFQYSTSNANEKNWIGIYHTQGGPDDEKQHDPALKWEKAPEQNGIVEIEVPVRACGEYKAYFLADDGYKWLAEPITFTPRSRNENPPNELRIMTYNLWSGGTNVDDFERKQIELIKKTGVDIVGLQEATGDHAKRLGNALGWNYHQANSADTAAIISRHPIVKRFDKVIDRSAGVAINVDSDAEKGINFWSIHTTAYPYGPYEFCFEGADNATVKGKEQESGRLKEITDVLDGTTEQREDTKPFFLVGDFNAPSHLDWTAETKDKHCGANFDWPTSTEPEKAGLKDSFRVVHPDPVLEPGNTWSPIITHNEDENVDEPQDRIDFIYHTERLSVLNSTVVVTGVNRPAPDYKGNDWTSDHAAVLTTYCLE